MPVAALFSRSTQGDLLEHRHFIFHDCGLANHETRAMVNKNARANPGSGVDIDTKDFRNPVLKAGGQGFAILGPQPVSSPIRFEGMQTLIIQQRE